MLLPRDAGSTTRTSRSIRNGIIDDELALALDAIRLKGATVWAIGRRVPLRHGDALRRRDCDAHRARLRARCARRRRPNDRGGDARATRRNVRRAQRPDKAPLIGFYAVDSRSEAIERPFPNYAPGLGRKAEAGARRRLHRTFDARCTAEKAVTFRDLARTISADMAKLSGSASAPLPVFDGALDRPIGGGEAVPAVRHAGNFDDRGVSISAGTLLGFENGAGIALYDGPLRDAKRLAKARVTRAPPPPVSRRSSRRCRYSLRHGRVG